MQTITVARLGVIGDVHCNDSYLKKSIDHIHGLGIGKICCTGDVVDGTGDIHKCIEYLRESKVDAVLGNRDDWLLHDEARDLHSATKRAELLDDEIKYIESLPISRDIITPFGTALLCHGVAENYMRKINPDDYGYAIKANEDLQKLIRERKYRFLLNGHSHRKMIRDFLGLLVINAGSLNDPGFLTLDFENRIASFWLIDTRGQIICEKEERL